MAQKAEEWKRSLVFEQGLTREIEKRCIELNSYNCQWEVSFSNQKADFQEYEEWAVSQINRLWSALQKEKVKASGEVVQTLAMDDAGDEEYNEEEEDDDTDNDTNDEKELTDDSFRSAAAEEVANRQPSHAPKVPPIGLASQSIFAKAADRGEARASSAFNAPPQYERGCSRSSHRGPVG